PLLEKLPKLKFIAVTATGYDCVDVAVAKERGIAVSNVPEYGTRSVAQAVFALLLEMTNQVGAHAASVRDGGWQRCPDFCYTVAPLVELSGKTLGIVGFGRIGGMVAEVGKAFGMEILVHTRTKKDIPYAWCDDVNELFRKADVISFHCPLTPQTEKMVNAQRLELMKPTSFIVNTARGKLIDEATLAEALNAGKIAGAALDVLSVEPPQENPLLKAKNCIVTPHVAWATYAARKRLMDVVVENVRAFQAGKPQNVVNK
ncbi:MAG TPA: D-2-hydroxyacid dehydrogenase, partial [Planctomycetota bacterium]|nr:D-2-hydroxyacid dehydrogenase [Planctomycetota bacterium]